MRMMRKFLVYSQIPLNKWANMKGCTFAIFVVFSFIQQLWDLVGHLVEGWGTAQGERHQQGA